MVKRPKKQQAEDGTFLPNGATQKSKLNRNIHDAAPAKLNQMIMYKAEEAGTWFGLAETKIVKPTQRCHICGTLVPKRLDERWHTCPECNTHCDRDANASRTLLRWFHEEYILVGNQPCRRLTSSARNSTHSRLGLDGAVHLLSLKIMPMSDLTLKNSHNPLCRPWKYLIIPPHNLWWWQRARHKRCLNKLLFNDLVFCCFRDRLCYLMPLTSFTFRHFSCPLQSKWLYSYLQKVLPNQT